MPGCPICKHPAIDISCNKCKKCFHWNCTDLNDHEIKLHKNNPYKPWRCKICVEKYCKKCNKTFPISNYTSINCGKCQFWYHLSCSGLDISKIDYLHNDPDSKWICM